MSRVGRPRMAQQGFHEDLDRTHRLRAPGSDRAFGVVCALALGLVGLWPLVRHAPIRAWAVGLAAAFLLAALAAPRVLAPLNRLWFRVGEGLERVTTPLFVGIIFFGAVTPTAWILRLVGKAPLALSFDRAAATYWIPRRPPGPAPASMRQQF